MGAPSLRDQRTHPRALRGSAPPGAFTALLTAAILIATATPATAADCPNELRRAEQGVAALALPDCRAYELVSPHTFPQQGDFGRSEGSSASLDGDALAYPEYYPGTEVESSGQIYLSKRGTGGWAPEVAVPQQTAGAIQTSECNPYIFYSADFSLNVLKTGFHFADPEEKNGCKINASVLDPRENPEYANLFMHSNLTGAYELLSVYPEGAPPSNSEMRGGSPDLGTVVFSARDTKITPDDPPGTNHYVWSHGVIRLLGYLPDGTPYVPMGGPEPALLSIIGSANSGITVRRSISEDGSRIFFSAAEKLYVRLNPIRPQSTVVGGECTEPEMACTVQVDRSRGPGASGGGHSSFASADGSKTFFTSDHEMTVDSTAVPGKRDLYEYDVDTDTLKDLTVHAGEAANVQNVTWVSQDGSYVFFVAGAALTPGAVPGDCLAPEKGNFCNLYVEHEGTITLIASLLNEDSLNWGYFHPACCSEKLRLSDDGIGWMQSSPNGEFFAFTSSGKLTAYDSGGVEEIYLYNTRAKHLSCASCPRIGQEAVENVRIPFVEMKLTRQYTAAQNTASGTRSVLDSGRVVFESGDRLVPEDTNEAVDVYMYENGAQYLLSGGKTENNAHFLAGTPSGADIFILTAEPLLQGDSDGTSSIYDARIGGGFPEPPPFSGCEGEACRTAGTSASFGAAGSGAFQGPGDQAQRHRVDCDRIADRALKTSREAKSLRRAAGRASILTQAGRLRRRASQLAGKSKDMSESAKRCRRGNRRAGK